MTGHVQRQLEEAWIIEQIFGHGLRHISGGFLWIFVFPVGILEKGHIGPVEYDKGFFTFALGAGFADLQISIVVFHYQVDADTARTGWKTVIHRCPHGVQPLRPSRTGETMCEDGDPPGEGGEWDQPQSTQEQE